MKKRISRLSKKSKDHDNKGKDLSTGILRNVAFLSICLMLSGFVNGLLHNVYFSFPGPPTLAIDQITSALSSKTDLVLMSVGIILFALLPSLRVALGINQFIHHHEFVNLAIATIVLIELAASFLVIFGLKGV